MEELQIFKNQEFGTIRTTEINGEPYFVGRDVAIALGYTNANDAMAKHCKGIAKRYPLPTDGGIQEVRIISEGDMYRLIASSKLPAAEKFESWIFDEVIPTIRKHGAYMTPETLEKALLNPDGMIKVLQALKEEQEKRKALEAQNEEMKPKALFAEAVSASKSSILIGDLAKIIKQNGHDIGQKRLFEWLRDNGWLIKQKGASWNMPTQRSMEMGLFEIKESTFQNPDGSVRITKTPKVTGRGQVFFINKLCGESAS